MDKARRSFSPEFKRSVVDQIRNGTPIIEVRRKYNLGDSVVRKWLMRADDSDTALDNDAALAIPSPERDDAADRYLARLQRTVAELREQNTFLERMAKFFAQQAWPQAKED